MYLDSSDLNLKTLSIINIINKIDIEIEKIEKKILEINKIYIQYEFNKNLKLNQPNSYLKFQVEFLINDRNYFINIKKIFNKKFLNELLSISEYIILIIISLDDLDIGYLNEKKNIMNKIMNTTPQNKIDNGRINEIVNIIINNLNQTKSLIDLFEKFIIHSHNYNKKKNIHSKNLKVNLMNKKSHIDLEYKKCCEQLNLLIIYFFNFSKSIESQILKQELIHFFVTPKNT